MTDLIYQIPGDVSAGPLGVVEIARRKSLLQGWADSESQVRVQDSPGGPLSIESFTEEALCVAPMLRALRATHRQPDAVIIGCYGYPGLAALRESLDCPVIGPLESSFHLALQVGKRIGIITVVDEVIPMLDQLVRSMGLEHHYPGSLAVNIPVLELADQPEALLERAALAAEALLERGADVISLGCMSMAFLGIAEALSQRFTIPFINPARCALKTAEVLVSLKISSSRAAYPQLRKPLPV